MSGKTLVLLYLGAVTITGIYFFTNPIDPESGPYQFFVRFIIFLIICGNAIRSFSDFEIIKAATSKIGGAEIKITFLLGAGNDKYRGINTYRHYSVEYIDADGNLHRKRCKVTLTDFVWLEI